MEGVETKELKSNLIFFLSKRIQLHARSQAQVCGFILGFLIEINSTLVVELWDCTRDRFTSVLKMDWKVPEVSAMS
jgi:hypothetical protein